MLVVTTVGELNLLLRKQKNNIEEIGFVPTMGALHHGHISLIKEAKSVCKYVVSSIFVNPTQFNNPDDLAKYPRTIEEDKQMLEEAGCDLLFLPSVEEMYPKKSNLKFDFGTLETVLEGAFRPGHFNGVGLIVSKLFHMVQPDHAFFGQKDLQQFLIIQQLVNDLSFPIELHCCPIIREEDGLAMSSRNKRLNSSQREIAPIIYKSLEVGVNLLNEKLPFKEIESKIALTYSNSGIKLEYFKLVDIENLEEINEIIPGKEMAICVACYIDEIRLIDNIIFNV